MDQKTAAIIGGVAAVGIFAGIVWLIAPRVSAESYEEPLYIPDDTCEV